MVTFATISGKRLSEKAPKRKHSAADVLKKVKKTLHENAMRRSSPQPVNKNDQNGIHPAVPGGARGCPAVSGGARRNGVKDVETEPHQQRVMARITAVKQTPSNQYLGSIFKIVLIDLQIQKVKSSNSL